MKELQTAAAILAAYFLLTSKSSLAGIFGPIKSKSRFLPVYSGGRVNPELVRAGKPRPGVYIIKVNGNIKYIGYSASNVYKTLTRHFQSWEDSRQTRVTYPRTSAVTARVIYTNTGGQAAALERALILKHRPADNPNKYDNYTLNFKDEQTYEAYKVAEVEAPF